MANASNDFAAWRERMGFNKRQVAKAAAVLGLTTWQAGAAHRGDRPLSEVERLAMAARRAGLEPWAPSNDHEAEALKAILQRLRAWPSPWKTEEPPSVEKAGPAVERSGRESNL